MSRRDMHFNVRPRFTPGSPALVNEHTALHVAKGEKMAYEDALTGTFGTPDLEVARAQGLKGIVEAAFERGDGWDVRDVLTGEQFRRERVRATKVTAGMVVVQFDSGPYLVPGKRIAKVFPDSRTHRVTLLFGSRDEQRALEAGARAPYELPSQVVDKYDTLTIEKPLPEGKSLPEVG
jgi:hypothetical protein